VRARARVCACGYARGLLEAESNRIVEILYIL
jgi:hypothetical protein